MTESVTRWELWLARPDGTRIDNLSEAVDFSITRVLNDVGDWNVALPGDYPSENLAPDNLVEFWRAPAGGALACVGLGFIQTIEFRKDGKGCDVVLLSGPDQNDLLARRIVAYKAGTAQASKTDYADDMMKTILVENYGASATDADRNLSTYLSIAADTGGGQSLTKAFSHRNVLRVLQDLAEASRKAGTAVYFDVVPVMTSTGTLTLRFTTGCGQLGLDRSGTDQALFGEKWGNLDNPFLIFDYSEERSVCYVGGQGEESDREVVEVEDSARSRRSIWARREVFRDARSDAVTAGLTAAGNAQLRESSARIRLGGTLKDTPACAYGKHWSFGDRVVVEHRGYQGEGVVRLVSFQVTAKKETVKARFEVEE